MAKKIVIRADLVNKKCRSEILSVVAKIKGIKSMDIDAEKCTLTVVGDVDPVCLVLRLSNARFAAAIVSVEDDKPKPKKTAAEEACKDACGEKLCRDACCCESGAAWSGGGYVQPSYHYYGGGGGVPAQAMGYPGYCWYEERRSTGGECTIL